MCLKVGSENGEAGLVKECGALEHGGSVSPHPMEQKHGTAATTPRCKPGPDDAPRATREAHRGCTQFGRRLLDDVAGRPSEDAAACANKKHYGGDATYRFRCSARWVHRALN